MAAFVTGPLLTLKVLEHEQDFSHRLEEKRFYTLDAVLFAFHALLPAIVYPPLLKAQGYDDQIPLVHYLSGFNGICSLLYLVLPEKTALQRRLRIPLHLLSFFSFQMLFPRHATRPGMVMCSSIWEGYAAVEALLAHLFWPAAYPSMAAMSLPHVLIVQVATWTMYYATIPTMCNRSFQECTSTGQQYDTLYRVLTSIANSLPFSFTANGDPPFQMKCSTVLTVMVTGVLVIFSLYLAFTMELKARQAYASQVGDRRLHSELYRRQPALWQIFGEFLLALVLVWNIAGLAHEVLYLHTSFLGV